MLKTLGIVQLGAIAAPPQLLRAARPMDKADQREAGIRRSPQCADDTLAAQGPIKAARKLRGKSLLEWVVRRVTDCQQLGAVIVVLADNAEERSLSAMVPPDVPVYLAHHKDPLGRLVEALGRYPAASVVRVCADNPFVDPVAIDRLVTTAEAHPTCDYISFCLRDGKPVVLSPLGIFAEWCSAQSVRAAHRDATSALDRRHVTRYLYSHPEKFQVRLIPVPPELAREDLRLRIDIEEDWDHAQVICDALAAEEWDWRRIAGLLDNQPTLLRRMAALNREQVPLPARSASE